VMPGLVVKIHLVPAFHRYQRSFLVGKSASRARGFESIMFKPTGHPIKVSPPTYQMDNKFLMGGNHGVWASLASKSSIQVGHF
jgi:hypothetical protein